MGKKESNPPAPTDRRPPDLVGPPKLNGQDEACYRSFGQLNDADRYRKLKTMEGQVIAIDVLRYQGADFLDQALDDLDI